MKHSIDQQCSVTSAGIRPEERRERKESARKREQEGEINPDTRQNKRKEREARLQFI
jgi:hypothetical protein